MDKIVPRTRGARFSQQIDCLIYLAQKKMTPTNVSKLMAMNGSCGLSRLDFSSWGIAASGRPKHQRYAELAMAAGLIWIERNRRL